MAIDKYTLKDGSVRYRATTYIKNQRVQKRGFLKKKDAQRWIDHTRVAGRVEKPITFNEMADEFLEAYEPTVKPSTYYNATRNLRHARQAWGNKKIGAITGADAQRLTNQLAKDYISFDVIISQTSLVFTHASLPRSSTATHSKKYANHVPKQKVATATNSGPLMSSTASLPPVSKQTPSLFIRCSICSPTAASVVVKCWRSNFPTSKEIC